MPDQLPPWIWPSALLAVCGLAAWRGGDEERLAAGGLLANWAVSLIVFRANSEDTQWPVFLVDGAFAALCVWIAMRSRRYWPLLVAGVELLVVALHLGKAVDTGVSGWAYLTAQLAFSYLVVGVIGYAAWTAPRYADTGEDDELNPSPGATRR